MLIPPLAAPPLLAPVVWPPVDDAAEAEELALVPEAALEVPAALAVEVLEAAPDVAVLPVEVAVVVVELLADEVLLPDDDVVLLDDDAVPVVDVALLDDVAVPPVAVAVVDDVVELVEPPTCAHWQVAGLQIWAVMLQMLSHRVTLQPPPVVPVVLLVVPLLAVVLKPVVPVPVVPPVVPPNDPLGPLASVAPLRLRGRGITGGQPVLPVAVAASLLLGAHRDAEKLGGTHTDWWHVSPPAAQSASTEHDWQEAEVEEPLQPSMASAASAGHAMRTELCIVALTPRA